MNEDEAYAHCHYRGCRPERVNIQSGLCVDMHNLPSADVSFAESASANWLAENCL